MALSLFLLLLQPATFLIAWLVTARRAAPSSSSSDRALQPRPTIRYQILFALSFCFWCASVVYLLPHALPDRLGKLVQDLQLSDTVLHLGSVVTAICGEALTIKALLTFDNETLTLMTQERRKRDSLAVITMGSGPSVKPLSRPFLSSHPSKFIRISHQFDNWTKCTHKQD